MFSIRYHCRLGLSLISTIFIAMNSSNANSQNIVIDSTYIEKILVGNCIFGYSPTRKEKYKYNFISNKEGILIFESSKSLRSSHEVSGGYLIFNLLIPRQGIKSYKQQWKTNSDGLSFVASERWSNSTFEQRRVRIGPCSTDYDRVTALSNLPIAYKEIVYQAQVKVPAVGTIDAKENNSAQIIDIFKSLNSEERKNIQSYLKILKYYEGDIDGYYGKQTYNSLVLYTEGKKIVFSHDNAAQIFQEILHKYALSLKERDELNRKQAEIERLREMLANQQKAEMARAETARREAAQRDEIAQQEVIRQKNELERLSKQLRDEAARRDQSTQKEVDRQQAEIQRLREMLANQQKAEMARAETARQGEAQRAEIAQQDSNIKEVISEGYGRDIPSAAQNAAQNALNQIVGSFMDASKILKKHTQIQDGIRSETKQIKTDIKEYSQGSIQYFELIEVKNEQPVRVKARVKVRVEDFRAYVKKVTEAEVQVSSGLFAQMQIEKKQANNGARLLYDNVIYPLFKGEGLNIVLGNPMPLSQTPFSNLDKAKSRILRENNSSTIVGIRAKIQLDNSFDQNMHRTLKEISSNQAAARKSWDCPFHKSNCSLEELWDRDQKGKPTRSNKSMFFAVRGPLGDTIDDRIKQWQQNRSKKLLINYQSYRLDNFEEELGQISAIGKIFSNWKFISSNTQVKAGGRLILTIEDANAKVLTTFSVDHQNRVYQPGFEIISLSSTTGSTEEYLKLPWTLIEQDSFRHNIYIKSDTYFWILMALDPDTLRSASQIRARIETTQ